MNAPEINRFNTVAWVEGRVVSGVDPSGLCPGNFCDPLNLTSDELRCWQETYFLFKETGVVAIGFERGKVELIHDAMQDVANAISPTNGVGHFRHYLGRRHIRFEQILWGLVGAEKSYFNPVADNYLYINDDTFFFDDLWAKQIIVHELGHLMAHHEIFGFSDLGFADYVGATCNAWLFGKCVSNYHSGDEDPVSNYGGSNNAEDLAESWNIYVLDNERLSAEYPIRNSYFQSSIETTLTRDGFPSQGEFSFADWFGIYHSINGCNIGCSLGTCAISIPDKEQLRLQWESVLTAGVSSRLPSHLTC